MSASVRSDSALPSSTREIAYRRTQAAHRHRPNPLLCASATARLLWATGALAILWAATLWALA